MNSKFNSKIYASLIVHIKLWNLWSTIENLEYTENFSLVVQILLTVVDHLK